MMPSLGACVRVSSTVMRRADCSLMLRRPARRPTPVAHGQSRVSARRRTRATAGTSLQSFFFWEPDDTVTAQGPLVFVRRSHHVEVGDVYRRPFRASSRSPDSPSPIDVHPSGGEVLKVSVGGELRERSAQQRPVSSSSWGAWRRRTRHSVDDSEIPSYCRPGSEASEDAPSGTAANSQRPWSMGLRRQDEWQRPQQAPRMVARRPNRRRTEGIVSDKHLLRGQAPAGRWVAAGQRAGARGRRGWMSGLDRWLLDAGRLSWSRWVSAGWSGAWRNGVTVAPRPTGARGCASCGGQTAGRSVCGDRVAPRTRASSCFSVPTLVGLQPRRRPLSSMGASAPDGLLRQPRVGALGRPDPDRGARRARSGPRSHQAQVGLRIGPSILRPSVGSAAVGEKWRQN